MGKPIVCDVCDRELKEFEWKEIVFELDKGLKLVVQDTGFGQIGFTDRNGLTLCQDDLNVAAFILDSILGDSEQLAIWKQKFAEYTKQVLETAKTKQDTANR